jgi:hypothetical protein
VIPGGANRRSGCWIELFLSYTQHLEAPPIWRKWAAISTVASTLERKVWIKTSKGDLYPNLYTLLVGAPGTGKSITISVAEEFLRELEDPTGPHGLHISPTSMTMASMVDALEAAKRSIIRPGAIPPHIEYNSLIILADELSALIHEYNREFMAGLTKIYDGGVYSQTRRGANLNIKIPAPQLNILAGTTPSALCQFMPEGAWDQGFASRIVMVYSGDRHLSDIFDDEVRVLASSDRLAMAADLRSIGSLFGQIKLAPEAIAAFRDWREAGEPPTPTHPKLTHYCSRRTAHLLKLCAVSSAARTNTMLISLEDFQQAKGWLIEAETFMPDIFLAGTTGGDSTAMEETWHFVWANYAKRKKPIPEHEVIHFVKDRVPNHSVLRVIEIMEKSRLLKAAYDPKTGAKTYEPGPKRAGPS